MDALETRTLLDAVSWTGGAGDNLWHTPANWSNGLVPTAVDDVAIPAGAGSVQFTGAGGTRSVHSVVAHRAVTFSGGTLVVGAFVDFDANLTLSGGTLSGGTYTPSGGAAVVPTGGGGTLHDVIYNGDLTLLANSDRLTVTGTTTFPAVHLTQPNQNLFFSPGYVLTGAVLLEGGAVGGRNINLTAPGTLTIGTTGSIRLLAGGAAQSSNIGNSPSMTLINNGLISAESSAASPQWSIQASSFTNNGTVQAITAGLININATNWSNSATGVLLANGGTLAFGGAWSNGGSLVVNAGTLNLGGTFATAAINVAGATFSSATVNIVGTLDNTANTLTLNALTGSWRMTGGAISGGTLNFGDGRTLTPTSAGGTLASVAINGDLTLLANSDRLTVTGTTTFPAVHLTQPNQNLFFSPGYVLTGAVLLEGGAVGGRNINLTAPGTLTIGTTGSIRLLAGGAAQSSNIGNSPSMTLINNGLISAESSAASPQWSIQASSFTNNGTVQAITAGLININATNWSNSGVIRSIGGTVNLGGTFATSGLNPSGVRNSGGVINITGTLNNANAVITLNAVTGSWRMSGGTIHDGTVNQTAGTSLLTSSLGGTLHNVVVAGDLVLNTNGATLRVSGSTSFPAVRLSEANTTLELAAGYTLTSLISGEGIASPGQRRIRALGSVTFGALAVVRLASGAGGPLSIEQSGSVTVINNGLITAEEPTQTFTTSVSDLTNNGTVRAMGGGLSLQLGSAETFRNAGSLKATNGGTLRVKGNTLSTAATGLSVGQGSTIDLRGSVMNGPINPAFFGGPGRLLLNGTGQPGGSLDFEAMSRDAGAVSGGFANNFVYGTIELAANTHVRLTDLSDNSMGAEPEAVYVNSLIVPSGSSLDLNGRHLYARALLMSGTVVGGTVTQIADSGSLGTNTPTPGQISLPGELDEWSFFGFSGRSVTVFVNADPTGLYPALPPALGGAVLSLVDASGNVLATNSGDGSPLSDFQLPSNGTYRIRIRGAGTNVGNYTVTVWDVTPDVSDLVLNTPVTGAIATPFNVDRWTFSATAGQQVQFHRLGRAQGLLFSLTGPNGFIGFTDLTISSGLVSLPANGAYTLSVRGNAATTGQYSFQVDQTAIAPLPIGPTVNAEFPETGTAHLYRVDVTEATPLLVSLDYLGGGSFLGVSGLIDPSTELYVRFGLPPTPTEFDYRFTEAGRDHQITVRNAQSGSWYVLAYARHAGMHVDGPLRYSIQALASGVFVTDVTPGSSGAGRTSTLTVTGAGFGPGTQVSLLRTLDPIVATRVEIDSFTQLTATVTIPSNAEEGEYTVRVLRPGIGSYDLPSAFHVGQLREGNFVTRLIFPEQVSRNAKSAIYVEFENTGTLALEAPLLRLQKSDVNDVQPLLTLDKHLAFRDRQGLSNSVQIYATGATPGRLGPREKIRVPVYFHGCDNDPGGTDVIVDLEIVKFESDNIQPVGWDALRDELRPPSIPQDAWNTIYGNIVQGVGNTWGDFITMLSENAQFLSRLGQKVVDVQELWSFEVQQAIGFNPVQTLASSIDASMLAPGGGPSYGRTYGLAINQRYESSVFGRGWYVPWETRLNVEPDGAVNIVGAGGSRRRFTLDARYPNAVYRADANDSGILLPLTAGEFELRESSGSVTRFNSGRIAFVEDANGNRITAGYVGNQLTTLGHSSGAMLSLTYNGSGRVQSIADSVGRTTHFSYDPSDQYLMTVTAPDGQLTSYTYITTPNSPRQHALSSVTSGGVMRTFTYDDRGHLSSTFTGTDDAVVTFTYDTAGTVTATDAAGGATQLRYDHRGRLGSVVDPFGNVPTTYTYGADGRIREIVDPLGQSSRFTWCACGHLTSSTDARGNTTRFGYTNVGPNGTIRRMTSFTDANLNQTRYTYDSRGNLLSTTYPDQSVERVGSYDTSGSPLSFVNRRGQVLSNTYNAAGQVMRQTFADGTHTDFTYDARGRMLTAADAAGTTTFEYDNGDRLTRVTYPNARFLAFTYDPHGRRASMIDQTGFEVTYTYDSAGRLSSLHDGDQALIVQYTYDAAGRLSRKDNGNGTFTRYQYDEAGNVLIILNQAPNGAINSRFSYTYDALGRRTRMTTIDGTWEYGYDGDGLSPSDRLLNRGTGLTSAVFTPVAGSPVSAQDLKYVYDSVGNRIRTIDNGVTREYTTNNLNQYTEVGGDTLVYDADGNLVSRSGPSGNAAYTYDQLSRLTRVVTPDGTWVYEYDALGNRITSTLNGTRTEYMMDPTGITNLAGEYDITGSVVARYIHGLGLVSSLDSAGIGTFFEFDAIGSTSALTNDIGSTIAEYAYLPFGEEILATGGTRNSLRYVGQFGTTSDGSGLLQMRARDFSTDLGRFTTIDPIRLLGGDSNSYSYVYNLPVDLIDPTGTSSLMANRWPVMPTSVPIVDLPFGVGTARTICKVGVPAFAALGGGVLSAVSASSALAGPGFAGMAAVGNVESAIASGATRYATSAVIHASGRITYTAGLWPVVASQLANPRILLGVVAGVTGFVGVVAAFAADAALDAACSGNLFNPPEPPDGPQSAHASTNKIGSRDPNHLHGPAGFGTANWVRSDSLLPYRIEFENYGPGSVNTDGTPVPPERHASAPAQRVAIFNTLSPYLDLNTFFITGFGFGDFEIVLDTPQQAHSQIISMTLNGTAFEVWFDAALDFATRTLRIVFQSMDPTTMLPPDVLTGFLPPEDGTGNGRGYLAYTVQALAATPSGTEIRNVALISFDDQAFIATNQIDPLNPAIGTDPEKEARVTIDNGRPTAFVQAMPLITQSPRIAVTWSAVDDAEGSGVARVQIFVRSDGGPWKLWKTAEAAPYPQTAVYRGHYGSRYEFRAVATDNVGWEEPDEAAAEASTYVEPLTSLPFVPAQPPGPVLADLPAPWDSVDQLGSARWLLPGAAPITTPTGEAAPVRLRRKSESSLDSRSRALEVRRHQAPLPRLNFLVQVGR